jgi:hypothetical protein
LTWRTTTPPYGAGEQNFGRILASGLRRYRTSCEGSLGSPSAERSRWRRWRCPGRCGTPRVTSVLIGASSVAQLEENLAAAGNSAFSYTELAEIDSFAVEAGINIWSSSSEE